MKPNDFYMEKGDVVQVTDVTSKFYACCVQIVNVFSGDRGLEGYVIAPFGEAFKTKFRWEQVEFIGSAKLFFVK